VAQGINIADAAADNSVVKKLDHFIFSSLSDVRKWSKGKYTQAYHFDSKAKIENHIKTSLPQLATKLSTVQIGWYASNWKSIPAVAPQKQADGSFVVFRGDIDSASIPFVVTNRDTGAFVKALVEQPPGKNILGVSEMMDWPAWTETWGRVMGVKATLKWLPFEKYMERYPELLREEVGQSMRFNAEFGWTGGDPNVFTPDEVYEKLSSRTLIMQN
jgi:hypothetical protein